jgi:PAS domain S-box-containing protein
VTTAKNHRYAGKVSRAAPAGHGRYLQAEWPPLCDLRDRQSLERELLDARTFCRSIVAAADGMIGVRADGIITEVSDPMCQLSGFARDDLVGSAFRDLFSDADRARDVVDHTFTTGPVRDLPLTLTPTGGPGRPVSVSTWAFGSLATGTRRVFAMVRDPAAQTAEPDRATLDGAGTDFVAQVSHELRSPLTAILGYLELLRAGRAGPLNTEHQSVVNIIDRNSQRLLVLIDDLLLLSRLDAETLRLTKEPVRLAPLVESIHESLLPAIYEQGIKSRLDLDPSAEVDADRAQLERVAANLISNAVKFTPAGGQIDIVARHEGDEVVLTVRDTGIGVPLDEQEYLFTRFFRSSISSELEIRGTGLGLFIVRRVIEGHGGTVTAQSAPGIGTTFTVRLPSRSEVKDRHPEEVTTT